LKCDGARAETRFRLSAKRTSPFKSAGGRQFSRLLAADLCSSAVVNPGYTMFRGSVKSTGYPLHSPVSPSLPLSCVTVCHHISSGVYFGSTKMRSRHIRKIVCFIILGSSPGCRLNCGSRSPSSWPPLLYILVADTVVQ